MSEGDVGGHKRTRRNAIKPNSRESLQLREFVVTYQMTHMDIGTRGEAESKSSSDKVTEPSEEKKATEEEEEDANDEVGIIDEAESLEESSPAKRTRSEAANLQAAHSPSQETSSQNIPSPLIDEQSSNSPFPPAPPSEG